MGQNRFEMKWPTEQLTVDCYTHQVTNYHYHWHPEEYELNILLRGSQDFCCGTRSQLLEEDDVFLAGPGAGHASFAQGANTRALVLHFSGKAFKNYLEKGSMFEFSECCSTSETRYDEKYRLVRFYAAQIFESLSQGGQYASLRAKGSLELLLAVLLEHFDPRSRKMAAVQEDQLQRETMEQLIVYMEEHYNEKLTLEILAAVFGYNRTYISTLFKNVVGINFHEYLTRLRFQHALSELVETEMNLTQIAIQNGFSDLKSFNRRFKETFQRTPAEYRIQLAMRHMPRGESSRIYVEPSDRLVQEKIREYVKLPV